MHWERIQNQLEQILQTPVTLLKMPLDEWEAKTGSSAQQARLQTSVFDGDQSSFLLQVIAAQALVLTVDGMLTAAENQLVELMLDAYRLPEKTRPASPAAEDERKSLLVKEWFFHQLEMGKTNAEMPDMLAAQLSFYKTRIPLLLYGEYSDSRSVPYKELKKLLDSFFGAEMVLIPLMEKEWLLLGPESLLTASGGERDGLEEESLEESLESICSGLYEMLSNEWVGEFHLTIHYPMTPAKSLLSTVLQMRETMMLGQTFHLGSNMHLPWHLHLEKLMNGIPEGRRPASSSRCSAATIRFSTRRFSRRWSTF
ncbi:PucR family transcriptional regulator [Paenibacillus sp. CC-CFT747]|nr:PucR family transcriptional regulator [Paenibacillus sp. CC-CFT747]